MTKLYVGNLSYSTTQETLSEFFAEYGPVASAIVITDKMSGRSKGFGFVELEDDAKAADAIKNLDGADFDGRNVKIAEARPMEERN
ncbi:RNA recognition motif domain-containing protein [Patescibacteria group bacterium]